MERLRIKRATYEEALALDRICLPEDEPLEKGGVYWVIPGVAYTAAKLCDKGDSLALLRTAVRRDWRGKRLHARLIRVRERWGREHGADTAITYTLSSNYASIRGLIRAGYLPYSPQWAWVGRDPDTVYWQKAL